MGHNAISVYGQSTSDWSARARELKKAARCMRSQAKKAETEAWLNQLRLWSGGDKTYKHRTHSNLNIFDQVTEINIDALTQWCEQHRGMRIEVAWRCRELHLTQTHIETSHLIRTIPILSIRSESYQCNTPLKVRALTLTILYTLLNNPAIRHTTICTRYIFAFS